ncbi:MAG: rubrerythrin-like domain-containing protein [Halobacteriaceae archaeon]
MRPDPHADVDARFECIQCGRRLTERSSQRFTCPDCDGSLRNLGVARDV